MTTPLEPIRHEPRVEPASPSRRVERSERDPERRQGGHEHARDRRREEQATDEPDGLHVDVLA